VSKWVDIIRFKPLSGVVPTLNPLRMAQQMTVTLTGSYESVAQLLRAAHHQAWLAQADARPRMHDALTELDYILQDQIAAIANAAEDDKADAEMESVWID
jgi:Holliday junction resolvasome RuvABC DNA-binding subunit